MPDDPFEFCEVDGCVAGADFPFKNRLPVRFPGVCKLPNMLSRGDVAVADVYPITLLFFREPLVYCGGWGWNW
jgi:hypothetical protein